jgi:hypothetical protein
MFHVSQTGNMKGKNFFPFREESTAKAENKNQRDEERNNRDDLSQEMSLKGKE